MKMKQFFFMLSFGLLTNFSMSTESNSQIVEAVIKEIQEKKLDVDLYNAFTDDLLQIFMHVRTVMTQMQKNKSTGIIEKNKKDDMVFDYKASALLYKKLFESGFSLFSEEKQIYFLTYILFYSSAILSSEDKMTTILNSEQMNGILFLMAALGIEFTFLINLKKIVNIIYHKCEGLRNYNLEDLSFESTLYDIFYKISEDIIKKGLLSQIGFKIASLSLQEMKLEIQNFQLSVKSNTKKNKKK